jgi:hypothetical protein
LQLKSLGHSIGDILIEINWSDPTYITADEMDIVAAKVSNIVLLTKKNQQKYWLLCLKE